VSEGAQWAKTRASIADSRSVALPATSFTNLLESGIDFVLWGNLWGNIVGACDVLLI